MKLLLDRGANINAASPKHGSVLSIVSASDPDPYLINMLLERGANVNTVGGKHGCATNAAIAKGYGSVLSVLIAKCPDLTIPSERGQTAWELASEYEPPVEEDATTFRMDGEPCLEKEQVLKILGRHGAYRPKE